MMRAIRVLGSVYPLAECFLGVAGKGGLHELSRIERRRDW